MKKSLRQEMLAKRDSLNKGTVKRKSDLVLKRLYALAEFKAAKCVMCYVSFRNEVDTEPLIRKCLAEGKRVVIPKIDHKKKEIIICELKDFDKELVCNHLGIMEPKEEFVREIEREKVDFVIVPGIAFDSRGHRLGWGGGYYDKFIAALQHKVKLAALAFEYQIVESIPTEAHDQKVDLIVTESKILALRN